MEWIIGIIILIVIFGSFSKKSGGGGGGGGGCTSCGSNDIRTTHKAGYSFKCRSCGNEMK